MTLTSHPNLSVRGERVFWHDQEIEYINASAQDGFDWTELVERCIHLESLGITPRTGTVVWHWPWFASMPYDSTYRCLLQHTPAFYQHGCTEFVAQALRACNVPPPAIVEPDGSIVVMHRGVAVIWDGVTAQRLEYSKEIADAQGIYHAMRAARYNPARMGQSLCNGPCYAEYDMVEEWLDDHAVNIGGVIAIMAALGLDS